MSSKTSKEKTADCQMTTIVSVISSQLAEQFNNNDNDIRIFYYFLSLI